MKLIYTIVFFTITTSAFSFWKWTKVHSLDNGKRFESTSFSIGGKGYVTCGIDTNDNCYNDLWEYDPAFDVWTQKANLPASYRRGAFGFEINGYGYVGGGIDDAVSASGNIFNDFWMYDPLTNTWTSKATIPLATFRSAGVSCNSKGYMIGGATSWAPIGNIYEYSPTLNSWTPKNTFPGIAGGREAGVATSINNKIYFGLGKDDSYFQNDWWEFSPIANTWIRKADFPSSGRNGAFAFTLNNMAIVGMGSDGGFASDTWWYNVTANTWNYTCGFSGGGRRSVACFAIGSVGYMGTGKSSSGTRQDFYRLDADVGLNELDASEHLFLVYPNPVLNNEPLQIITEPKLLNASVVVMNSFGQTVLNESLNQDNKQILPNGLQAGIYFVSIVNQYQILATKKIIIM